MKILFINFEIVVLPVPLSPLIAIELEIERITLYFIFYGGLGFGFGLLKSLVNRVIRNAAVFPVPVCACPAISWPESEIGSVFACIEVQYLKSASLMPFRTTSGIGRDSNVIWLNYCSKFWDRESIEFQE